METLFKKENNVKTVKLNPKSKTTVIGNSFGALDSVVFESITKLLNYTFNKMTEIIKFNFHMI